LRSYTSELIGRTCLVQLKKIPQSKARSANCRQVYLCNTGIALFYGGTTGLPSYSNNTHPI
jgi:hypothetical protein